MTGYYTNYIHTYQLIVKREDRSLKNSQKKYKWLINMLKINFINNLANEY